MELESYFEFLTEDAIRLVGTRVGIETVLRDYNEGASPEETALRYPTLTLEQIYATMTYYLTNRDKIDAYLYRVQQRQETAWQEYYQRPSVFARVLRERLERPRRMHRQEEPVSTAGA